MEKSEHRKKTEETRDRAREDGGEREEKSFFTSGDMRPQEKPRKSSEGEGKGRWRWAVAAGQCSKRKMMTPYNIVSVSQCERNV